MPRSTAEGQVRLTRRQLWVLVAIEAHQRVYDEPPTRADLDRFFDRDCGPHLRVLRAAGLIVRGLTTHRPRLRLTAAGARHVYPVPGWPREVRHAA